MLNYVHHKYVHNSRGVGLVFLHLGTGGIEVDY
jgi:hypothetical protein